MFDVGPALRLAVIGPSVPNFGVEFADAYRVSAAISTASTARASTPPRIGVIRPV
jgi:hypothetical protein